MRNMDENASETNIRMDGSKDSTQGSWTRNLIVVVILVTSASFSFGFGISAFNTKPTSNNPSPANNSLANSSLANNSLVNSSLANNSLINQNSSILVAEPQTDSKSETVKEVLLFQLPQIIFFVGNMVAALSTGMWYNLSFINRKSIFLVNNLILMTSVLFALIAIKSESIIYLSRFLHGYQGGMACVIVPTYLAEIAPQRIRGKVGFLHQLQITLGIFFGQIFALPQIFSGLKNAWTLTYLVGAFPSMLSLALYKLLPMSPVELVTRFNDKDSAQVVLRKLRKERDVSADMRLIEQEHRAKQSTSNQMGIIEVIKSRNDRWQLIVSVTLLSVQALSGINVVLSYSKLLFEQMSKANVPYLTLTTGFVNVVATVIGVGVIEKVGRRSLILKSNTAIIISHVILTIIFVSASKRYYSIPGVLMTDKVQYTNVEIGFAMVFFLIFIVAFAIALGPIPFLYSSEITRSENRNAILNIALTFNYIINIFIVVLYIVFEKLVGGYAYLMFAIPVFVGTILFYFKMIETKNKNIEEIDAFFNAKRRSRQVPNQLNDLS